MTRTRMDRASFPVIDFLSVVPVFAVSANPAIVAETALVGLFYRAAASGAS